MAIRFLFTALITVLLVGCSTFSREEGDSLRTQLRHMERELGELRHHGELEQVQVERRLAESRHCLERRLEECHQQFEKQLMDQRREFTEMLNDRVNGFVHQLKEMAGQFERRQKETGQQIEQRYADQRHGFKEMLNDRINEFAQRHDKLKAHFHKAMDEHFGEFGEYVKQTVKNLHEQLEENRARIGKLREHAEEFGKEVLHKMGAEMAEKINRKTTVLVDRLRAETLRRLKNAHEGKGKKK